MEKTMEQVKIEFNTIKVILTRPIYDDLSDNDLDSIAHFIAQYKDFDFATIIEKEPIKNSLDTLTNIIKKILEPDYKGICELMTKKLWKKRNELERKCQDAKEKCDLLATQEDKSVLQQWQNKWKESNEEYTEAIEKWNGFDPNQVHDIMSICRKLSETLKAYSSEIYDDSNQAPDILSKCSRPSEALVAFNSDTYIKYDTIERIFSLVCTTDNKKKELFDFQEEEVLFSFLNLKYTGNYLDRTSKGSKQRVCILIDFISKKKVVNGKGDDWKDRICEVLHINYDEKRISSYISSYREFSDDLEKCFIC